MGIEALNITCQGIDSSGKFKDKHTGRGEDVSPELVIGGLSPKAQTLVVTLEDMSHPIEGFTHWIIWNIPAASVIPEGMPAAKVVSSFGDAFQGKAYGIHRYAGPKPPRGKSHAYAFTVYALDCKLDLPSSARKRKVLKAAEGHVLQCCTVCGRYE